jgi:hypothetical protein
LLARLAQGATGTSGCDLALNGWCDSWSAPSTGNEKRQTVMTDRTKSVPPTKAEGYEVTRFNALRHGVLSRYTVLPWEDADEYQALVDALVAEHTPRGPTEEHLVEELAGILWRKRRLRLAEGAAFRRELAKAPDEQTIRAAFVHLDAEKRAGDRRNRLASIREEHGILSHALELLRSGKKNAYDMALGALQEHMRKRWAGLTTSKRLELIPFDIVEASYAADAGGLLGFLQQEMTRISSRRQELESPELIEDQALGEALDSDRLEGLARYEIHLDRKLERMVAMLIRLQELRAAPTEQ